MAGLTKTQLLDVLVAVMGYPDALTAGNLALVQGLFERVGEVGEVGDVGDARKYMAVLANIYAASLALNVDIMDYVKDKSRNGALLMCKIINQTQYTMDLNGVSFKMVSS